MASAPKPQGPAAVNYGFSHTATLSTVWPCALRPLLAALSVLPSALTVLRCVETSLPSRMVTISTVRWSSLLLVTIRPAGSGESYFTGPPVIGVEYLTKIAEPSSRVPLIVTVPSSLVISMVRVSSLTPLPGWEGANFDLSRLSFQVPTNGSSAPRSRPASPRKSEQASTLRIYLALLFRVRKYYHNSLVDQSRNVRKLFWIGTHTIAAKL